MANPYPKMLWEQWGTGGYNLVLIQERLQEKPMFATNISGGSGGGGGGGGEGGGSSHVSSSIQCNLKYGHQNHITRIFKYFQFLDNTGASLN